MSVPAPPTSPTAGDGGRWLDAVLDHHKAVLLVALVVTLVAGWLASHLRIDTDLRSLLPRDSVIVRDLEAIERDFGAIGTVHVLIRGADAPTRHAFTEAVAAEFADHPLLAGVDYQLESDFFTEHALYYLSDAEMDELSERVLAWQHYEFCSAAPDVCTTEPDARAGDKLERFMERKRDEARDRVGFERYYEREGIEAQILFLRPERPATDFAYSSTVAREAEAGVNRVRAREGPWTGSDLRYDLVGPYVAKADEQRIVQRDMLRSGAVALGGVLVVLFALFRSFRAILILIVPLLAGLTWSLGATQLVLGHLNSITSLISSVVMGIGIDAGIHLLTRARRERLDHPDRQAIQRAFGSLIRPLVVASSTTVGAFGVMMTSAYPAFREFGIIAGMGVGLCLLAMLTVYPALLLLIGIKVPRKRPRRVTGLTRRLLRHPSLVFAGLLTLTVFSVPGVHETRLHGFDMNGRGLQSDTARERIEPNANLISEIFGMNVHFGALRLPDYASMERQYHRAREIHAARVARGESVVGDIVAAPRFLPPPEVDLQARRAAIEALTEDFTEATWAKLEGREPRDEFDDEFDDEFGDEPSGADGGADEPGSPSGGVDTDGDTTPAEADAERQPGPVGVDPPGADPPPAAGNDPTPREPPTKPTAPRRGLDPELAKSLRTMVDARPFTVDDLPDELLRRVRSTRGEWAILAYPDFDPTDVRKDVQFMEETRAYGATDEHVYAGESAVLAFMYHLTTDEWPVIVGMAAILISGIVLWHVKTLSRTAMTLVPLLVAGWWLLGVMGWTGIKFTLLNVPILPAILGIGVDNGVYLATAIAKRAPDQDGLGAAVDHTGRAILAATSTTAVGFAAFLVADSGGLRGIGVVAVLGILMAAFAALTVLPTMAALGIRRADARENGRATRS